MPRPKRLEKHRRPAPEYFDILEHENVIDEHVYSVLAAMREEANKIEDRATRERWLDSLQTFARTGNIEILLRETEWRRNPVPMDTFIYDPMYLGLERGSIYPKAEEALFTVDEGDFNEVVLMGAIGIGKALDVHTLIPTKDGWKSMDRLQTGDIIFDENGDYTRILKAHDVMHDRPCYRVEFSDGESLVADEEHLWYTETKTPHGNRVGSVKTTKDIFDTLMNGRELNHRIPLVNPIQGEVRDLPIEPYAFGAWLGDGSTAAALFYNHESDIAIVERMRELGTDLLRRQGPYEWRHKRCPKYLLVNSAVGSFTDGLNSLGVIGEKRIPWAYLRSSLEQRIRLMQGLMDTDGTIGNGGVCEWVSKSELLTGDFVELARSLGLKPTVKEKMVGDRVYYRVTFTAYRDRVEVFYLERKRNKCRYSGAQASRQTSRYIRDVVPVESRPVRCITVDSPSKLYLAGEGMIPTHNTTIANIGLCRDIYKLSCMRNPQTSFGIQSKSFVTFTVQSVRFSTAKIAIFQEFGGLINGSPYFKHVFPYDKKISSHMIFPEHHIRLMPVTSSTTGIISMNVIGGMLDEANFMQKITKSKSQFADDEGSFDQAKELYNTLAGRRKSRFNKRGRMPGRLYLASSSRYPTDFTQERASKAVQYGGTDPKIYVFNYSQWEGKPRNLFMKEEFKVQIGNESFRSKVLEKNEIPNIGCKVINVPMDFFQEFRDDPDKAIRDYAGLTVLATNPFIARRETIQNAFDLADKYGYRSPYNLPQTDLKSGVPLPIIENLRLDVPGYRVAHIDLGLRRDAAGIAIGHVAGYKVGGVINPEEGSEYETSLAVLPIIAIDAVMRVVPPHGGEIDFSQIRKFLKLFRDRGGVDLKYVTTDNFQSVDTRQILRKDGFITDYQSVEKVEPYRTLRDTLYDGRLLIPAHEYLAKELREIEVTIHNNKEKVDHRPDGSKDVADAVCGVVQFLMRRRSTWANFSVDKGAGYHFFGDSEMIALREHGNQKVAAESVLSLSSRKRVSVKRRPATRHKTARK